MPKEYIYEPWTAPLSVQKAAGCIIGVDYPKPILDHKAARAENLTRMKAAYDHGPPPIPACLKRGLGHPGMTKLTGESGAKKSKKG